MVRKHELLTRGDFPVGMAIHLLLDPRGGRVSLESLSEMKPMLSNDVQFFFHGFLQMKKR